MNQATHGPHVSLPHPQPSPADTRLHAYAGSHRRQDVLAWSSLILGVASFLLAAFGGSVIGAVLGLVGFAVSVVAQMFSATTAERWLILPGWALAFVGGLLNLFYVYS